MAVFDTQEWITVSEAARLSGGWLTEGAVRARIRGAEMGVDPLPVLRVGHAVLVSRQAIEELSKQMSMR